MRIALLDGRDLAPQDEFPGNVIVNEAFARTYLDGRDPVGSSLETIAAGKRVRSSIVGYVRDARYRDLREPVRPTVYVPFADEGKKMDWATFVVRTKAPNPLALAGRLRREVKNVRSEFGVVHALTQTELADQHTVRERLLAILSLFFAAVALILACVGLYGVLNYSVLQRRREIGIRIALGAPSRNVIRSLSSHVFLMVALGMVSGLGAGLASARYLASLLYGVNATDLHMLGLPTITLLIAALVAALPPVFHALRIDPVATLRAE
jgi:hypothetical protein